MQETGEFTKTMGGKKRTIKFGIVSVKRFDEIYGLDLFGRKSVLPIIGVIYCGLLTKAKENELPDNFSDDTASEWMEDLSDDDLQQIMKLWEDSLGKFEKILGMNQNQDS
jgi:hypothetical protein